ncbi:MAG: metallophosphoesterase [Christensenellaceae bacterium]|jgi:predicted MPP superfamily phosphohydrolase
MSDKRTKRKLKMGWKIFFIIVAVIAGIHAVHALTLDQTVEYAETSYYSESLPDHLDGYTFAFITDTHNASPEDLEAVAKRLNAYSLDALFLGGDHALGDGTWQTMQALSNVNTVDGIYGVEGNHDDYKALFSVMQSYGITPLDNTGVALHDGLYLAGVQDLWNRAPNVDQSVSGAQDGDFVILLCHNPDYSMQADTSRANIILSGHTHGGHITLFGMLAPALLMRVSITDYGQMFMGGWCTGASGTDVYVSRGIGSFRNVPRVFARPQVIIMTLHSA